MQRWINKIIKNNTIPEKIDNQNKKAWVEYTMQRWLVVLDQI